MLYDSEGKKIYAVRPNKSELKREHEKIKLLAISLIDKTPPILKKLSINEGILEQIYIAQKINGGAYRRQIKHIANQLTKLDEETLERLVNNKAPVKAAKPAKKTLLIDEIVSNLITQSNDYLEEILNKYSQLDRQKLRTLILAVNREKQKKLPPKAAKTLKKYLHEQLN